MKHALLTLIGAWLIRTAGFAQTPVYGTIIAQTWTLEGSPYHMVGDILVAGLTIDPGVTVEAQGDYVFEVAGILNAVGTPTDPIVFQASDTITGWQGLFYNFSSPGSVLMHCDISGSINSGIRIDNAQPIIQSCSIHHNTAVFGGGINVISGTRFELVDCELYDNAISGGSGLGGGGLYAACDTVVITFCRIHHNSVTGTGDDTMARGGGICLVSDKADISCSQLHRNRCFAYGTASFANAYAHGGGIYCNGSAIMQNVVMQYNLLHSQGAGSAVSYGGGAYLEGHANLYNCIASHDTLVTNNGFFGSPYPGGGGIWLKVDSTSQVVNSTMAFNPAHGLYGDLDTVHVVNSILWENAIPLAGKVNVEYSDVQGGWTGTGNINVNPIFQNDSVLVIVPGSPCIDGGIPGAPYDDVCLPPSIGSELNDMGAHGGPAGCNWQSEQPSCPFITTMAPLLSNVAEGPRMVIAPNPFTSEVLISGLPKSSKRVSIIDAYGRILQNLALSLGQTTWNGRTASGTEVPPGMYLVTVISDGQRYTQRVIKQ